MIYLQVSTPRRTLVSVILTDELLDSERWRFPTATADEARIPPNLDPAIAGLAVGAAPDMAGGGV